MDDLVAKLRSTGADEASLQSDMSVLSNVLGSSLDGLANGSGECDVFPDNLDSKTEDNTRQSGNVKTGRLGCRSTVDLRQTAPIDCSTAGSSVPHSIVHSPLASQMQAPFQIMNMDFDLLRSIRKSSINISFVLGYTGFKITDRLYALVKQKTSFSAAVTCLEILDESGAMRCSCLNDIAVEHNIKIGSIVVLENFSLWKMRENHINVVAENVVGAYE